VYSSSSTTRHTPSSSTTSCPAVAHIGPEPTTTLLAIPESENGAVRRPLACALPFRPRRRSALARIELAPAPPSAGEQQLCPRHLGGCVTPEAIAPGPCLLSRNTGSAPPALRGGRSGAEPRGRPLHRRRSATVARLLDAPPSALQQAPRAHGGPYCFAWRRGNAADATSAARRVDSSSAGRCSSPARVAPRLAVVRSGCVRTVDWLTLAPAPPLSTPTARAQGCSVGEASTAWRIPRLGPTSGDLARGRCCFAADRCA
jgi:hypothetical protein